MDNNSSSNKINIIHCSDLHLGAEISFLKNHARLRRLEIVNTLQNIVDICNENFIDLLIISGDLFENNHVEQTIISSVKKMFASIPKTIVAIAAGNHDYYAIDSPYSDDDWSENVCIFSQSKSFFEFPEKKLRIWGSSFVINYTTSIKLNELNVPRDDYTNIMVYHGDLVSENQNSKYNPISISDIESSNMDYIALGHIHNKTEIKKSGNTFYAYCGSPDGQGFDETGEKGIYMGYIIKGYCQLSFYNTYSRLFIEQKIDISNISTNEDISNEIQKIIKQEYKDDYFKHFYNITLTGKINPDFNPNCKKISEILTENIYYANIINKTLPDISLELIASEISLKGIFVQKMLQKINITENIEEKDKYEKALYLGLKSFEGEISFYEDK